MSYFDEMITNKKHFLGNLSESYKIFENIQIDDGLDFVILGPTGIFVLKLINLDGPLAFNGNELTRWKIPFPKDILSKISEKAFALKKYLQLTENHSINAILVFSDFRTYLPRELKIINGVFVTQKKNVSKLIQEQKNNLTASEIQKLENILNSFKNGA